MSRTGIGRCVGMYAVGGRVDATTASGVSAATGGGFRARPPVAAWRTARGGGGATGATAERVGARASGLGLLRAGSAGLPTRGNSRPLATSGGAGRPAGERETGGETLTVEGPALAGLLARAPAEGGLAAGVPCVLALAALTVAVDEGGATVGGGDGASGFAVDTFAFGAGLVALGGRDTTTGGPSADAAAFDAAPGAFGGRDPTAGAAGVDATGFDVPPGAFGGGDPTAGAAGEAAGFAGAAVAEGTRGRSRDIAVGAATFGAGAATADDP